MNRWLAAAGAFALAAVYTAWVAWVGWTFGYAAGERDREDRAP